MKFDRRRFLGAAAVGATGLAVRPGRTMPLAEVQPVAGSGPGLQERAQAALERHGPLIAKRDVVGVVDFALPSRAPRFHLLHMDSGVVSTHLVAHGRGSDPGNSGWVERFSNVPGSNASSEGCFLTGEIYMGKHGRSRRLYGLEPANSMAAPRGIVIHAAGYVGSAIARETGRIGRSQGCFAVSQADIDQVLEVLGPGRLLLAWK